MRITRRALIYSSNNKRKEQTKNVKLTAGSLVIREFFVFVFGFGCWCLEWFAPISVTKNTPCLPFTIHKQIASLVGNFIEIACFECSCSPKRLCVSCCLPKSIRDYDVNNCLSRTEWMELLKFKWFLDWCLVIRLSVYVTLLSS